MKIQQLEWKNLKEWLASRDAEYFLDHAVYGSMPRWEAEELLQDYGIPVNSKTMKELWQLVDEELATP